MTSDSVSFRLVRFEDHDRSAELVALCGRCPMEADISLLIERAPDFFALCRARGAGYTVVAEADGETVGCVSVARRAAWTRGERREVAYVADLRVAPSFRRRGLARRILARVAEQAREDPACVYLFATAAGNAAVDAVVRAMSEAMTIEPRADLVAFQLFPLIPHRVEPRVEIRRAEEGDRADLIRLCDEFGTARELCPVLGEGGLDTMLSRSPGMSLGDFLVACRGSRIVAALSTWDAHQVKQTRVVRMPFALRSFAATVRAMSRVLPLPSLPGQGDFLRIRYIRQFAAINPAALAALVRTALNEARMRGDHLVLFSCAKDDPVQSCVRGLPKAKYHYRLLGASTHPDVLRSCPDRFCHDDTSLA